MKRHTHSLLTALAMVALPLMTGKRAIAQVPTTPPAATPAAPVAAADPRLAKLKTEALTLVEGRAKQVQEIVDMLFSFQELGFQELDFPAQDFVVLADFPARWGPVLAFAPSRSRATAP